MRFALPACKIQPMALDVYRKKRKFGVTPEPRGRKARVKGNRYVIQKHAATRLHYDLRLELDGVMKSWAVTRGPSLVPGEKRLAVEIEDHPVEYNTFEGTIPKGEYGGGTVMIWDRGTWAPEEDPHRGLKKGHLDFSLQGEKLHGHWHLVRMHRRPGEKRNNWLLIKASDEDARTAKDADILEEMPDFVVSGRSIEEIAAGKGKKRVWHSNKSVADNVKAGATRGGVRAGASTQAVRARAPRRSKKKGASRDAALPDFVPPSLATLRDTAPNGRGWVHEIKFDGYRTQARLDHGKVKLLTRKGLDWAARFPNIAADVARLAADTALIDGEIVVENSRGVSDFSMLQAALSNGERDSFVYYVFDLLHLDGEDLSRRPLIERKAALKELLEETGDSRLDPLQRAFHGRRLGRLGAGVPDEPRRHRVEARGCAVSPRPLRQLHQDQMRHRAGVRGRRLCAVDRRAEGDRRAGGRLLSRRQADLCRPRRHRLYACDREGLVEAVASAGNREAAVRRNSAGRSAPPRRALGRAEDGDRGPFPRLDQRRHRAAGRVQGRARGQAGERGGSRGAGRRGRLAGGAASRRGEILRQRGEEIEARREGKQAGKRRAGITSRKAPSASPIRIASTGPMPASPSRTSPTTTARCGT